MSLGGLLPAGEPPARPGRRRRRRTGSPSPAGRDDHRRRARRLRLRQRAPAPPARRSRPSRSPAAPSPTRPGCASPRRRLRAPRVVERRGLGLEGGVRHRPRRAGGRRRPRRRRCATSPGSRPTPSHVRAGLACPPSSSGRGRRPRASWTASATCGSGPPRPSPPTPGFDAYPYPEYSEVFFGPDYRVLRGGSWATHPRVASPTFRNWDLPQRRQIFAGLRLARCRSTQET